MNKKDAILLNNWSVIGKPCSPYTAPELIRVCLKGLAINHPKHPNEEWPCITTPIKNVDGRYVKTENTLYKLGKINTEYREFLKKERPNWDWKNPITIIGKK